MLHFAPLQIDQKITKTVKCCDGNEGDPHIDALRHHIFVPVAVDWVTLEERQEETGHCIQTNEDTECVAESLVVAAGEESNIGEA